MRPFRRAGERYDARAPRRQGDAMDETTGGSLEGRRGRFLALFRNHEAEGRWDGRPLAVESPAVGTIVLDAHAEVAGFSSDVVTRLRAPVPNPDAFRFRLKAAGLLAPLATLLGAEDIEVGDPAFDRAFVVQSADPARTKSLFADAELRAALVAARPALVEVKDDEGWFGDEIPPGVDELYLEIPGKVLAPPALAALFAPFELLCVRFLATRR